MLFSTCDVIDSVARPTIGLQFACSNLCCFQAFVDLRPDFVVRGIPRCECHVDEILFHSALIEFRLLECFESIEFVHKCFSDRFGQWLMDEYTSTIFFEGLSVFHALAYFGGECEHYFIW